MLCSLLHLHSGFPKTVTHSSFFLHNHSGLVVWQDVEDESVSSGPGWAPSPAGIPTLSPPDRFDEFPLPYTTDLNPEVLPKRTTAPSSGGVGDAPWDISLMTDATFRPRLLSSSTRQAADVTCPCNRTQWWKHQIFYFKCSQWKK